jgi:hypothetical protein
MLSISAQTSGNPDFQAEHPILRSVSAHISYRSGRVIEVKEWTDVTFTEIRRKKGRITYRQNSTPMQRIWTVDDEGRERSFECMGFQAAVREGHKITAVLAGEDQLCVGIYNQNTNSMYLANREDFEIAVYGNRCAWGDRLSFALAAFLMLAVFGFCYKEDIHPLASIIIGASFGFAVWAAVTAVWNHGTNRNFNFFKDFLESTIRRDAPPKPIPGDAPIRDPRKTQPMYR